MSESYAYVTLLLNSSYLPGTLALAQSLKDANSKLPIILLYSKLNIKLEIIELLNSCNFFTQLINIDNDILTSRNDFELNELLKRSELKKTLTKLNCWRLIQFDKLIYLDSDILILENIDHLFKEFNIESSQIVAASDSGWPDIFNSGLFLFKPDLSIFKKLIDFYFNNSSFDGADQGLLNEFFNLQSNFTGCKWLRLPFVYNCTLNTNYEYIPALYRFKNDIKVIHFIGNLKPWKNKNLNYSPNFVKLDFRNDNNLENLFELWWNCFEKVDIPNFTSINLLELSEHLQRKVELIQNHAGNDIELSEESVKADNLTLNDEETQKIPTEITQNDDPANTDFPEFYYKPCNNNEAITNESDKGEAWRMNENKVIWPTFDDSNKNEIVEEKQYVSFIDSYVSQNPIFPWEKSAPTVTRSFNYSNDYQPPQYSISLMDENENEENTYNITQKSLNSNGLIGFKDGFKFFKYLNMVEKLQDTQYLSKEDAKIEEDLDNDDKDREILGDDIDKAIYAEEEEEDEKEKYDDGNKDDDDGDDDDDDDDDDDGAVVFKDIPQNIKACLSEEDLSISKEDAKIEADLDNCNEEKILEMQSKVTQISNQLNKSTL